MSAVDAHGSRRRPTASPSAWARDPRGQSSRSRASSTAPAGQRARLEAAGRLPLAVALRGPAFTDVAGVRTLLWLSARRRAPRVRSAGGPVRRLLRLLGVAGAVRLERERRDRPA